MNARPDPDAFEVTNNSGNSGGPSVSAANSAQSSHRQTTYKDDDFYSMNEIYAELARRNKIEKDWEDFFKKFIEALNEARGGNLRVLKNIAGPAGDSIDALYDSAKLFKNADMKGKEARVFTHEGATFAVGYNKVSFDKDSSENKIFDQKAAYAMVMLALSEPNMMPPNAIRVDDASAEEKRLIENAVVEIGKKYNIALKVANPLPAAPEAEPEPKACEALNPFEGKSQEEIIAALAEMQGEKNNIDKKITETNEELKEKQEELAELEEAENPAFPLLEKISNNLRDVRKDFVFDPQMIAGKTEEGFSIYKIAIAGHDIYYAKDKLGQPFLTKVNQGENTLLQLDSHKIEGKISFPVLQTSLTQEWKKPDIQSHDTTDGVLSILSRGRKPLTEQAKIAFTDKNAQKVMFPSLSLKTTQALEPEQTVYKNAQMIINFSI